MLMAEVEVGPETELEAGWSYDVTVFDQGRVRQHEVTLSFADYDLWSRGKKPPSRVVERVFEFLLEREPAEDILPKFDCSVVRRYFQDVDEVLPTRL